MSEREFTPYDALGGEAELRKLVHRFYELMDTLPEARGIRAMHEDLPRAEIKLFAFLSGWLGGPDLFVQKFGPPMLRRRHFPFSIGENERDQWMTCMSLALAETRLHPNDRQALEESLYRLANHMRNKEG